MEVNKFQFVLLAQFEIIAKMWIFFFNQTTTRKMTPIKTVTGVRQQAVKFDAGKRMFPEGNRTFMDFSLTGTFGTTVFTIVFDDDDGFDRCEMCTTGDLNTAFSQRDALGAITYVMHQVIQDHCAEKNYNNDWMYVKQ